MIVIVDFGSQTSHLISRRIKEMGVEAKIVLPENIIPFIKNSKPKGIILSGGPASVYEKGSPSIDKNIFNLNLPVLGICYGMQLTTHLMGGRVKQGKKKEFGPAKITINNHSPLFKNIPKKIVVWMSHGDEAIKLPQGFINLAETGTIAHAAIGNVNKQIFGVQFHPEVIHTQFGEQILSNFLFLCNLNPKKTVINKHLVENIIADAKDSLVNQRAICALSGGVDSSVAALLIHKAVAENLQAIYVDSGLMRKDETTVLEKTFKNSYHMKVEIIRAGHIFINKLKGVIDPEKKRKVIGKTFIEILEKEAVKFKAKFLIQGTIYPDVIESAGTKHSKKIKTHHNVAGLPEKMKLTLLEPLRTFYKDEVRKIGKILKLPDRIIKRQPFPGPGLAIRIIGEVTSRKLKLLRQADNIVREEIKLAKLDSELWQAFAVLTGIKTTGVRGDNRAYGETIAIRALVAEDAMTAHWARLPYELLDRISTRIVNEIKEVNRVVYDITNKPPATMEWE